MSNLLVRDRLIGNWSKMKRARGPLVVLFWLLVAINIAYIVILIATGGG